MGHRGLPGSVEAKVVRRLPAPSKNADCLSGGDAAFFPLGIGEMYLYTSEKLPGAVCSMYQRRSAKQCRLGSLGGRGN